MSETMMQLELEHARREEKEIARFQRLIKLACEWQDLDSNSPGGFCVFTPNDPELDKHLRTRTGACARQLLRTLAGID